MRLARDSNRRNRLQRAKVRGRALLLETLEQRELLAVDTWQIDLNGGPGIDLFGPNAGGDVQSLFAQSNDGAGGAINTSNVPGVNNAAPIAVADDFTGTPIDEDSVLTILAAGILANDSDPEGDPLSAVAQTVGSTLGATVTINTDGSFSYDPTAAAGLQALAAGANANDTFQYTVQDARGGSSTAIVTVNVTGLNDAPIARDDSLIAGEDTWGGGNVLADNGSGADSDPDNSLTVTLVNGATFTSGVPFALASGALLIMNADGTFDYDPNGQFESLAVGETASDAFSYTIDDGAAPPSTATVTITILGANDQPVATDDTVTTDEDSALIGASVLVDNGFGADTDPDSSDTLSVTEVNGAAFAAGTPFALPSARC